jgi:ABC-2 type transport system ATP-binding protein
MAESAANTRIDAPPPEASRPATSGPAALEIEGLCKYYGDVPALLDVDLRIEPGEILALLGPNGAGKTTLASTIVGLRRPDDGIVLVNGIDVEADPLAARRSVGYAPQDLGVYPSLTVRENLTYFGELDALRGRDLAAAVAHAAEALGLEELIDRPVRKLSGGEQRRVHTAMALLNRPALLLLDEPTAGVDVATRYRVLDAVRSFAAAGSGVCYSTHYLGEVEALDANVAILDHGRVIARGSVRDIVAAHGESAVELSFDGPPPEVAIAGARIEAVGDVLRIYTERPAEATAEVLGVVGEGGASRLRTIEWIRPSLEAAFLALTGRRYDRGEPETEE